MLQESGDYRIEDMIRNDVEFTEEELKYLTLLSRSFPSIQAASTEIINLQAILDLPKGTEHFLSDLHGEYEAFSHMLRNASGVIKTKVDESFGTTLGETERKTLATLIYYPQQKLELLKREQKDLKDWYRVTLYRLVEVCRQVSSKYTRSKVRKALPKDFAYIIDELIHGFQHMPDQNAYYDRMIETIIEIQRADAFIIALCELITRLSIDKLHIIGDIYDRGPGAHMILDELMRYHDVDIQWGNHDILWMGAAAGNPACIAGVIRICCRYNNLDTLEDGYGISLRPLAMFAQEMYGQDPCTVFWPADSGGSAIANDPASISKIHKAITILQLKAEGQLLARHPEYGMQDRILLSLIDYHNGMISMQGKDYALKDTYFPTIDPQDPLKMHPEEEETMHQLIRAFKNNTKLQEHVRFLFSRGSMYKIVNANLLYHGCIPLHEDGGFAGITLHGNYLTGKALLDELEQTVRKGYFAPEGSKEQQEGEDIFWYLWCGPYSPLFGKTRMTTFERYFLDEKALMDEGKNPYYKYVETEPMCDQILVEFGLSPEESHIINGHVPVKVKKGESPVKGGGKLLIIDGGLSKAYHNQTGIAGYTLISNSHGMNLAAHEPFESTASAIREEKDIHSRTIEIKRYMNRKLVRDTDFGYDFKRQSEDLKRLLLAYRMGKIKQLV